MARTAHRHDQQSELLTLKQANSIHETALRILQQVGLEVGLPRAREELAARGYRLAGQRVFLEPQVVERFVIEHRRRQEAEAAADGGRSSGAPPDEGRLYLSVGMYAHHVHDLQADRIVPYTTDALIRMTKLVDVLSERGLADSAPGYPLDVAPALQPIVQYWVGALYSRHGAQPVDPISDASTPYIMEMAEVMGWPIRSLPVYVFSPLRLAGESLRTAMHYRGLLAALHVSAMPSLGGSAPVSPFGALALAAAEVLGAAVVLAELTGLCISSGIGLHALDLHSGSMVFGSPESYLFGLIANDMSAFYGRAGRRQSIGTGIHTRANFPGPQAAAEKAALMAAGALAGARWFGGAGILAVDEVFSAEQLLVDLEIRDGTERLLRGLNTDDGGYDWVEEVRQGVAEGAFMGVPSTVAHHRETYWYPQLFERGFLAGQGPAGRPKLAQRAREMVREYIARHNYELDPLRRRELERVVERAKREL